VSAVLQSVRSWLAAGRRVALARVIRADGSTPFAEGATMAINDAGDVAGGITSGCADGTIAQWALRALRDKTSIERAIASSSDEIGDVALLCGGRIDVRVEEVDEREAETLLAQEAPALRLLIAGASEYAHALCELAAVLRAPVTVVDPRPAFARAYAFPGAKVVCAWPDEFVQTYEARSDDAVLVLSHDVRYDAAVVAWALASPAFYVGALGSRRTQANRRRRLLAQGVSSEALSGLRAPLGLDLGARTAHETALSMLAEIIAVRNGRTGTPLRSMRGPIHDPRRDTATVRRSPARVASAPAGRERR